MFERGCGMTDARLTTWAGTAHRVTLHRVDEGPHTTMTLAVWSLAESPAVLSVAADEEEEDCAALLTRALTLALADVSEDKYPKKLIVPPPFGERFRRLSDGRYTIEVGETPGISLAWLDLCAELGTGLGDPRWMATPSEPGRGFLRAAADLFACSPWETRAGAILTVGGQEWCLGPDAPPVEAGELFCFTPVRGAASEVLVVCFAFANSEPHVDERLCSNGWPHRGALPILHRSSITEIARPLRDADFELASALSLGMAAALAHEEPRFQSTAEHPVLGEIRVNLIPGDQHVTARYVLDCLSAMISSGMSRQEAIGGVFRAPVQLATEAVVDAILPESELPRRGEWIARADASGLMDVAAQLDDIARSRLVH